MPLVLAALVMALAFASCDNGSSPAGSGGGGGDRLPSRGSLTITDIAEHAGMWVWVEGMTEDGVLYQMWEPTQIPANGVVTVSIFRHDEDWDPIAWADATVPLEIEIFLEADDGDYIAKGDATVTFVNGSASLASGTLGTSDALVWR